MILNNDVFLILIYVFIFLMNIYDYFVFIFVLEKFKEVNIFIYCYCKEFVVFIDYGIKFSFKKFSFVVFWVIYVWFC